jgi:hypothetical protein
LEDTVAKNAKSEKPKSDKSKGKRKQQKGQDETPQGASVAAHPRAGAQVRRAKGWGALAGFMIAAYLSFQAGVPADQAGLRALVAGAAGYMVAWACSVTVWRHLMVAEMRAAAELRRRRSADRIRINEKASADAPADERR